MSPGEVVSVSLPPASVRAARRRRGRSRSSGLVQARAVELVVVARAGRRAAAAAARCPSPVSVNESNAATGLPTPSLENANRPIFAFAGSARRAPDGGPRGPVGRVVADRRWSRRTSAGPRSRPGSPPGRLAVESAASLRATALTSLMNSNFSSPAVAVRDAAELREVVVVAVDHDPGLVVLGGALEVELRDRGPGAVGAVAHDQVLGVVAGLVDVARLRRDLAACRR